MAKRKPKTKRVIYYGGERISSIQDIPVIQQTLDPLYRGTMFEYIDGVLTEVCVHNGQPLYG